MGVKLCAEVKHNSVQDHESHDGHSKLRCSQCHSYQKEQGERLGHQWFVFLLAMAAQSCRSTFPAALLFEQLKTNIFFRIWSGITATFFFSLSWWKADFILDLNHLAAKREQPHSTSKENKEWSCITAFKLRMGASLSVVYVIERKIKWHWEHP